MNVLISDMGMSPDRDVKITMRGTTFEINKMFDPQLRRLACRKPVNSASAKIRKGAASVLPFPLYINKNSLEW